MFTVTKSHVYHHFKTVCKVHESKQIWYITPRVARQAAAHATIIIYIIIVKVGNSTWIFIRTNYVHKLTHKNISTKTRKVGKNTNSRGTLHDFFTTFHKYYFALKQQKTQEFCKNTNAFGFKTAENCWSVLLMNGTCLTSQFLRLSLVRFFRAYLQKRVPVSQPILQVADR